MWHRLRRGQTGAAGRGARRDSAIFQTRAGGGYPPDAAPSASPWLSGYGLDVTAVTVSVLVYGPAGAVAGMDRVRLAPNVLVPNPLLRPACTDASTAAVEPRP